MTRATLLLPAALFMTGLITKAQSIYNVPYRPQLHFSPKEHWMNDPNGMVKYKDTYHLFFQYYPEATTWGPMHWGHATSRDLVHWTEKPIALFPDSLGYIFSGSAVVDSDNTSGFGKPGQTPLVAIFTQSDPKGAAAGKIDFQRQSLAYSLDDGTTWTKYLANPVLKNPGMRDFRDPKVTWLAPQKKWIMTLATGDRVTFYSSPNLKDWKKESDFGSDAGGHGGVWECPDLFTLDYGGKPVWVLLVSINPGGPNGGSSTQYFTGEFDGHKFKPNNKTTKWIDYGPDDYAGVTWSNTGSQRIFLGWMSNWTYATSVPTGVWRSANTLPRQLSLRKVAGSLLLASNPIKELDSLVIQPVTTPGPNDSLITLAKAGEHPNKLTLTASASASFSLLLTNQKQEKVILGYDKAANRYYLDRTHSGQTDFSKDFAGKCSAPRLATEDRLTLTIYLDASSLEVFADGGLTVITALVFPTTPYDRITLHADKVDTVTNLSAFALKGIW